VTENKNIDTWKVPVKDTYDIIKIISEEKRPVTLESRYFRTVFQPSQTMSYKDLRGKTFIVTGASSGMGKVTALMLAQQGANVGLFDLRAPDAVAEEIRLAGSGECIALACNVQNSKEVDEATKAVVERFGDLHGK
jgi:FlaA1/EpsC-like NDP-sugar epimerase